MYNFLVNCEQIASLSNAKNKTERVKRLAAKRVKNARFEIAQMLKFRNLKENERLQAHLDPIIDYMQDKLNDAIMGIFKKD